MKDLIQFKKDKVEDPDRKKLRNAPRILPMNLKLQDKNGIEFGLYTRFAWNQFQIQKNFPYKA